MSNIETPFTTLIGYMDQFWGTLVIYPDGISPSSGEKIMKWRKWGIYLNTFPMESSLWGRAIK